MADLSKRTPHDALVDAVANLGSAVLGLRQVLFGDRTYTDTSYPRELKRIDAGIAAALAALALAKPEQMEGDQPDDPFVAGLIGMANDDPSLADPDRLREDRDEHQRLAREDGDV